MITKKQLNAVKKKTTKKKVAKKRVAKKAKKKRAPRRKSKNGVTIRLDRVLFCKELIKNSMNATAAYIAVNPSVKRTSAATEGHKLLRDPKVVEILTPMLQALFIDAGIEANYVFKRWVEMSQASPLDYFNIRDDGQLGSLQLEDITPAHRANLKTIDVTRDFIAGNPDADQDDIIREKIKITVVDQQKAVSEIAKHLGLLVDKLAEEDVERIGDLIEKGVGRIRASKDLDGWKSVVFDGEATEV